MGMMLLYALYGPPPEEIKPVVEARAKK